MLCSHCLCVLDASLCFHGITRVYYCIVGVRVKVATCINHCGCCYSYKFYVGSREAARECRKKKKEYVKCLENRVAVLENQNKTLIEELKALKDLYCHKAE